MSDQKAERRLSAILASDVAGYSRLMGRDEEGTHKQLNAHSREFIDPKIAEHRGRIVKRTGDGLLVEFVSAVEAARCAIDIQRGMAERNAAVPTDKRIEFRIGIHVGDVLIEDGDIFGDGVNIAARLEGIAAVGGICLSDDAYRQVRGKLDAAIEDGGEQQLKNITRPVRIYRVRPNAQPPEEPGLGVPDKPSIAVLAFQNMSGDPEQEYFADGIAEEITTTLSKLRWLFVIARNSSFTYKGKPVDVRQVGRELGVRYVLEGSVRKAGNRIRVTAQLIEATAAQHVWAERYDCALEDIFVIQDEITQSIAGAIAPEIEVTEMQRSLTRDPSQLGQWERLMRARWHARRMTRADCNEAIRLLDELARAQPHNALILSDLAWTWAFAGFFGWTKESFPDAMARMHEYIRRAITADDQSAQAQVICAVFEMLQGRHDDALRRGQRAIELDSNSSFTYRQLGTLYAWAGEPERAIQCLREALRLSPRDFLTVFYHMGFGWAHFASENYEQAAESAKRAIESNPAFPDGHMLLAVAAAHLGRVTEAQKALGELLELMPGLSLHDERLNRPPFRRASDRERFLAGLEKAGLPDEPQPARPQ